MRRLMIAVCLMALALSACGRLERETVTLGDEEIEVYLADGNAERSRGLQGYDELDPGEGMLFVFDDLEVRYFTMKGVSFPIDVIFFAEDLTVSAISPLDPGSAEIVASPSPSPYVLELPQGWAAENKIAIGSELTVPEDLTD